MITTVSPAVNRITGEVTRRATSGSQFSLFLDFDGTLVPIAATPATPQLDSQTRETLRRIANKHFCVTSIISGRSIEDLYPRIRLDGLIYAGNHGLEIRGRDLEFVQPLAAACRDRLRQISANLITTLRPVAGVYVEDKGLSASVHYRQVGQDDVGRVEDAVRNAVAREGNCFRMNAGKKVFEIVPRTNWHKGAAAQWINHQLGLNERQSIYIGDDTTDEDAFATLSEAITVVVGETAYTGAEYQLPGPQAVHEFLNWMAELELTDLQGKQVERAERESSR
jgi:trehalose 6-phosphate phosphatase